MDLIGLYAFALQAIALVCLVYLVALIGARTFAPPALEPDREVPGARFPPADLPIPRARLTRVRQ